MLHKAECLTPEALQSMIEDDERLIGAHHAREWYLAPLQWTVVDLLERIFCL